MASALPRDIARLFLDPFSLILGLGVSATISGLAAGMGQRWAARFAPTIAELATRDFYLASIEQQRAQLENAESRFVRDLQARREQILLSFEHQLEVQSRGYEQARWPFLVNPGALIKFSQAASGRTLNVIVAVQQPSYHTRTAVDAFETSRQLVSRVTAAVEDSIIARGSKDIVLYNETSRAIPDSGFGLVTNTWNFIKTEPTMLLRITPQTASRFMVDITVWGVGFSEGKPISAAERLRIDLGDLAKTLPAQEQMAALQRALLVTLSVGIVGLSDAFQATHYPQRGPRPLFLTLIKEGQSLGLPDAVWTHVCQAYVTALEGVARISPLLAADLAAKAALDMRDRPDLASQLLDTALLLFEAAGTSDPPSSLSQAHKVLRGAPLTPPKRSARNLDARMIDLLRALEGGRPPRHKSTAKDQ
jgi:hypothetical protein